MTPPLLPEVSPFSFTLEVSQDDVRQALADGAAFLSRPGQPGLTTLVVVRHASGRQANVCVNRDEDSVFFEAWLDDAFSEPCYTLKDTLTCAQQLLTDSL